MSAASDEQSGQLKWVWLACYVVLLAAIVWSLFYARRWALTEMTKPDAVGQWQAFREEEKQQAEHPGTVQRRVPKSVEPPALVLMRDYFGVSLAGAVLFSSLLYWIIAWLVTGALASTPGDNRPM